MVMGNIKIAIIEDVAEEACVTQKFIERYCLSHNIDSVINVFSTAYAYLDSSLSFDVAFLDIEMPHMDGVSLAEEIRRHNNRIIIVFVTRMARYAVSGYRVGVIDYVLKPISEFDFSLTMDKVMTTFERIGSETSWTIKTRESITTLIASDIYYVESVRHHLVFHTAFGSVEAYGYLKDVEDELGDERFFRASNCYLINLTHVEDVKGFDVTVGGDVLRLSRTKKTELMNRLTDYYGGI